MGGFRKKKEVQTNIEHQIHWFDFFLEAASFVPWSLQRSGDSHKPSPHIKNWSLTCYNEVEIIKE